MTTLNSDTPNFYNPFHATVPLAGKPRKACLGRPNSSKSEAFVKSSKEIDHWKRSTGCENIYLRERAFEIKEAKRNMWTT